MVDPRRPRRRDAPGTPLGSSTPPRRPPARSTARLGAAGEALAAAWYEGEGYRVLVRNWRCREGELDLVCRSGTTLVVCEVKTRSSHRFGSPAEAVVRAKRRRLRLLAARWLSQQDEWFDQVRFDVASVEGGRIEVVVGAF